MGCQLPIPHLCFNKFPGLLKEMWMKGKGKMFLTLDRHDLERLVIQDYPDLVCRISVLKVLHLVPGISNAEARQPGKAPNFSVNWTVGDQGLEVINATTGKDDMGRASRLCKNALYSRWVRLHSKVNILLLVQMSY